MAATSNYLFGTLAAASLSAATVWWFGRRKYDNRSNTQIVLLHNRELSLQRKKVDSDKQSPTKSMKPRKLFGHVDGECSEVVLMNDTG